jgi:hypothetical protein
VRLICRNMATPSTKSSCRKNSSWKLLRYLSDEMAKFDWGNDNFILLVGIRWPNCPFRDEGDG